MRVIVRKPTTLGLLLGLIASAAKAMSDNDAVGLSKDSEQGAGDFPRSYGYPVFSPIGKGGNGVDAAY